MPGEWVSTQLNWIQQPPSEATEVSVKTKYRGDLQPGTGADATPACRVLVLLLGSACRWDLEQTGSPECRAAGGKLDATSPSYQPLYTRSATYGGDSISMRLDSVMKTDFCVCQRSVMSVRTWLCSCEASLACCVSRVSGSRWYRGVDVCFLLASLYLVWNDTTRNQNQVQCSNVMTW